MTISTPSSRSPVRVRFAPSPTGYLHVGGARSLLFNWLYAQHHGGTLVMRIEDTDQVRSTREFERMLLSDVARLGIDYAEGPDAGGSFAPYRQSERLKIYAEHARKLLDEGKSYYCFCSEELLTKKREAALARGGNPHYDGTCAGIPAEEARARVARGEKAGIRFRASAKDYVVNDHVRGRVEFKEGMVGDFFITRSPTDGTGEIAAGIGFPVYNFCCVIDDALMEISHVIRAEEHLSNTARQLMIYDAFGWKTPEFAHISLVLGPDHQKLSKRNGDTSVCDYLDKGYLPEALLNFLVLLGWGISAGVKPVSGHPEVLSREEMIRLFGLESLQKAPAVFDVAKLQWMNAFYMRTLPLEEIVKRAGPYFEGVGLPNASEDWFRSLIQTIRGAADVSLLSDLPKAAQALLHPKPSLDGEGKTALADPLAQKVVEHLTQALHASGDPITSAEVDAIQKKVGTSTGAKGKALFMPMRLAITGRLHGPDLKLVIPLLGKAAVIERIAIILAQVGI